MAESATANRTQEAKPKAGRTRRVLGVCGRGVRIILVVGLVVLVAFLIYLSQIGLPPGMQEDVIRRLRQQGWEVQFSKMRLSVSRMGIVAENVYLRRSAGPQIYVRRAQCRLRPSALRRLKAEIGSVKLSGARVIWPLERTHEPASTFLLNNVRGELHFRANDVWDLQSFSATLRGARFSLSGTLTNGSLVRDWRVPQLRKGAGEENLAKWRAMLAAVQQVDFQGTPDFVTRFNADAARLDGARANLMIHVPGVASPWGSGTNLLISAHLDNDTNSAAHPLALDIVFERGVTPWAQATTFRFKTRVGIDFANLVSPTNLNAEVYADVIEGRWGKVNRVSGEVTLSGSPHEAPGLQTVFNLKTAAFRHRETEVAAAEIRATAWHMRTNWFIAVLRDLAATNRPLSQRLEQVPVEADFSLSGAKAGAVDSEELLVRTKWRWPLASLAVEGKIEEGGLHGSATLNTTNGQTTFDASSDIDPLRISPLLTESARDWFANYQWQSAPKVQAKGRFTLPARGNARSTAEKQDWLAEGLQTAAIEGRFDVGPCRYQSVPMDSAKSPFWLSNSVLCLPDLQLRRPEGSVRAQYTTVPATKDFHWRLSSQINPRVLRPWFPWPIGQKFFDLVEFGAPPRISGEIWGRWGGDLSRLGIVASVEATNFAVRGQSAQSGRMGITLTNLQLELVQPEITRPNERGTATSIKIDFNDEWIYFTNVQGNLDPYAVARAIGHNASNAIAPYVFATPPDIQVNGVFDFKTGRRQDDLLFLIRGGPFYWDPFHIHRIGGKLHWAGSNVFLNDVIAQGYDGQGSGEAKFEIETNGTSQFQFRMDWSDIDLHSLMLDLTTKSNNLEGVIRGNLQITSANSTNYKSWNGRGIVQLKDGLIWEFPIFGIFSSALNAFVPGLGNSRARDGAASYIITNSVIYTTDLEINTPSMRMQFNGTFDFDLRVNGRMEAELMRNVPGIGLVLSKIFWPVTKLFEYKIGGTLEEPESEPLYTIPKIILFPFSPIKTLKDLFGVDSPPPPPPK